MYEVDDLDTVLELHEAPKPDAGAPLPLIVSDEQHLLLAYLMSEPDPAWDGSYAKDVSRESQGLHVGLIQFRWPSSHMFGSPNDEAFAGHPLYARGLKPYAVFEVKQSSWIRRLERINSVHPLHNRVRFLEGRRHFIFAFHDSTFECIAKGFVSKVFCGSMQSATEQVIAQLAEPSLR